MEKLILYCQCHENSVSSVGTKVLRVGKERYEISQSLSVAEEQLETLKRVWDEESQFYMVVQGVVIRLIPPYPST